MINFKKNLANVLSEKINSAFQVTVAPEELADMGIANVLSDTAREKKRAERSKMGYMFDTLIYNNF